MRRPFAVLALAALAGCTTASPPPAPPPPPRFTATGTAQRVILVSFDGLGADTMRKYGAPNFERLTAHATRVIPVTPTATSSTHTAILTGAPPSKSGIVSNYFHRSGTPWDLVSRGLDTEIDAETILEAAHKAGKRVGSIAFPTVDATSPRRTPDWGVTWSNPAAPSRMIELHRADFHNAGWLPPTWGDAPPPPHRSFSPVLRARFEWSVPKLAREDADLAAYDTTDDGVANYDAFYVETRSGEVPLDAQRWFPLTTRVDDILYGTWAKITRLDPQLSSLTIYLGPVSRTNGLPESYRRAVEGEAGFWPGKADETAVREGRIDADTFEEQNRRMSDFLLRATLIGLQRMPADLVLSYQPLLDEAEHQFLTPEGEPVMRDAYATFDRAVGTIAAAIDPARDALLVTGDHGLAPTDTEVRVSTLLPPDWRAISNGNVTNIYRMSGDDNSDAVVSALTSLRAPDGSAVFERVERKSAASHPNSGDVVGYSFPRFALVNSSGETFAKNASHGQHGGLNTHPEFHTTLGATGSGIPPQTVGEMQQTEIAPLVRKLLGLPPGT